METLNLLQILVYSVIPTESIEPMYRVQEAIAALIVLAIIIYVLFTNRYVKYILTGLLLIITLLHYTLLAMAATLETLRILPLTIIETNKLGYSTATIDIGQITIIALLIMWRKNLVTWMKTLWTKTTARKQPIKTGHSREE